MKRSHNKRHFLFVTVLGLILGLASAPCRGQAEPTVPVPDGAQAGDLVDLKACLYESQEVEYAADCGTLVVPENRSDPDSRLIALPVIRVRATGDSVAEPIYFLNGGPGISNMGSYGFVKDLIEKHDIVMVGYRGVDGSVLLDCPETDEFFKDPPGDLTEQATLDNMAATYARCAARLQNEGIDTDGYTITEVVQDMEAARVALGYDRINLLSQSYGTRLAMIHAWMYPKSIHRSAMISVNPPGHFVWYPDVMDDQLMYYSELCKQDSECSGRTDDLAETIRKAAHNMPDLWLFLPIKKGNVLMATFMMLYHTDTAKGIFDAWIAAGEGDWSGLALLSTAIDFMLEGAAVWGESAAKAMSADYIFEPGSDPLAELMPPNSIIGAPGSLAGIAAVKGWPANVIADSLRRVRPSDVQTLLISGNIDFSTPARFARDELLPFLKNGHQVILSEFGHTGDIWGKQRAATIHMLKTFLGTGVVDDSHFSYSPMDFHVRLGYPAMAKIGLGVIGLIVIGIGALAWFIVRRVQRRRTRQVAQ